MADNFDPYALIFSMLGGSDSARLNLLQDMGVSFGPQEQFQPETTPSFVNPVGLQYAGDPIAASIFNEIEKGTSPIEAVAKAKKAGESLGWDIQNLDDASGRPEDPMKPDYWSIAGQYANKKAELDIAKADFTRQQEDARAQFEANQGLTMQDLVNPPSQFDVAQQKYGKALTPQSLLAEYKAQRAPATPKLGAQQALSKIAGMLPFNLGGSAAAPVPNRLHANEDVAKLAEDMLLGRMGSGGRQGGTLQASLDQMKQRVAPKAGVEDVLATLAALSRVGKD